MPDVFCKDAVFAGKSNKIPHIIMRRLQYLAAFQRPAELDGLAGAHQLDREDIFEVIQHLGQFAPADAAHAYMVFLTERSGDTVGACRKTKCLVLRHEGSSGVLGEHETT